MKNNSLKEEEYQILYKLFEEVDYVVKANIENKELTLKDDGKLQKLKKKKKELGGVYVLNETLHSFDINNSELHVLSLREDEYKEKKIII